MSEHKWEIAFGLLFAWLMARFVYPPDHEPYWVRVIQYSTIDDATVEHLKALQWTWNQNPPSLGDVPVKLDLIGVDDSNLTEVTKRFSVDRDTLLVIGHLPSGLTKKSLLTFMSADPPVPYIATSASADNLCETCTESPALPWLQPSPSNAKEADSMLLFAQQQKKGACLIVTDQSSPSEGYSDELTKDIRDLAKSRNVTIVETLPMGVGPLPPEEDLQKLNPDCVLYAGNADIALTLWRWLGARKQWLLASDGVIETNRAGKLAALSTDSVFFSYATNAVDATKSVYAEDAVGITQTLLGDLNRRGGNLWFRLRALAHVEGIANARHNLALVMKYNSDNRVSYPCGSSWDQVCIFKGNRRENGFFHVWQQDGTAQTNGAVAMKDIDGWHPPTQLEVMRSVRVASSAETNFGAH